MSKINVDHLANNLPPKPFKFSRTLKANKTRVGYKNIIPWLVTNGQINVPPSQKFTLNNMDENGVTHVLRKDLKRVFPLEHRVVSVWSCDDEGFFWEGLYACKDTTKQVANHYNMAGGGISMCVSNLIFLGEDNDI